MLKRYCSMEERVFAIVLSLSPDESAYPRVPQRFLGGKLPCHRAGHRRFLSDSTLHAENVTALVLCSMVTVTDDVTFFEKGTNYPGTRRKH